MAEMCSSLPGAVVEAGFCAYELAIDLNKPRSVVSIGVSDSLVLERNTQSVVHLFDSDGDLIADSKRTLASAPSLNHGLAIYEGFIYASSDTTVYRWPFSDNFDTIGDIEIVVNNINADGQGGAPQGHRTRTLIFDDAGKLYISVGSNGNVDADSYRSRIRRFDLTDPVASFPIDFQTGEVFADGLRNEVGLAFDSFGVLWGVENSADNLFRDDMGGEIYQDNPAEELNRFREEDAGKHWGFKYLFRMECCSLCLVEHADSAPFNSIDPYCWTEYNLPEGIGLGRGTVWAWPSFLNIGQTTDVQCQSRVLFEPPVVAMQGHSAPLGITFYNYTEDRPAECNQIIPFPQRFDKYAFIAFHGSWNRDVPTGYKVVYVPFDSEGNAVGEPVDLLAHQLPNAKWEDGFRPVDVAFDACGRLIVTSDGTGNQGSKVVNIQNTIPDEPVSASPTETPTATVAEATSTSIPKPCDCPSTPMPSSSGIVQKKWILKGLLVILSSSLLAIS